MQLDELTAAVKAMSELSKQIDEQEAETKKVKAEYQDISNKVLEALE